MDIDESNLGEVPAAGRGAGRGRGRGAGGVPVLPEGLWGELSGLGASEKNGSDSIDEDDRFASRGRRQQDEDFGVESMMPSGFGRGRGGGGRGGGRGRGRGPEKDMKGPDWTCPSCSNTNWSWRSHCNKCQTAKPVSVLAEREVRDGAGGGFNERQSRVSANNVEITEDGFDDFGRRAKGRSQDKLAKEAAALARLQQNYGFLLNPESLIEKNLISNDKSQFDDAVDTTTKPKAKSENHKDWKASLVAKDKPVESRECSRSRSRSRGNKRSRSRERGRDRRDHRPIRDPRNDDTHRRDRDGKERDRGRERDDRYSDRSRGDDSSRRRH